METKKYNITVYDPIGHRSNSLCNIFIQSYDTLKEARKALKQLRNYKRNGGSWYKYQINFEE